MRPSNRITYRFDRSGNQINEIEAIEQAIMGEPLEEETILLPVHSTDTMTTEPDVKHKLNHEELYGLDLERLEQLIRDSNHKMSSQNEQNEGKVENIREQAYMPQEYRHAHSEQEEAVREQFEFNEAEHAPTVEYAQPKLSNEQPYPWSYVAEERYRNEDNSSSIDEDSNRASDVFKPVKRLTWTASLVTVLSAVLTGMLLGYLLLVQVFGSVWWQSNATAASTNSVVDKADLVPTAPITEDELAVATIDTSEEHYSYQLLQAGVFNQEKTRDETIAALKKAGYAAQYMKANNGKYYVYTALTTSALNSEPYKAAISGFELYRKEVLLQLPKTLQYNGKPELLNSYFTQSNALIAMYADLAAAQLEQPSFSAIGSSSEEAWTQKYTAWTMLIAEVMAGFTETDGQQYAIALQDAIKEAQTHMLAYQKKPSANHIWSVQASIVQAVLLQKEWFEQLS